MKKAFILLMLVLPAITFAQHKKGFASSYDLVVGTYTTGSSKGIYVYRFYPESGRLAFLNEIDDVANPSYLCIAPDKKFVYAVNETGKNGEVSAFSFEPKQGKLVFINKQSSGGADPCYIAIDKDKKNLFVANYSSGSLAVLPLNADGSVAAVSQLIKDEGHSIDTARQNSPHVHISMLSPDEKYLLYTDLGTDKLNIERYRPSEAQVLSPANIPSVNVNPGEGPRHIVFSKNKKHAYLLTEMGSNIHVYDYSSGKLTEKQTISILKKDFVGKTAGAAIKISPDGRFLYASNRLETNQIIVYAIDQDNGQLTLLQHASTYGKNPRDFIIDPTGKFLLVANQSSNNIVVFRINKDNGMIDLTGTTIAIGNPVCLKFTDAE